LNKSAARELDLSSSNSELLKTQWLYSIAQIRYNKLAIPTRQKKKLHASHGSKRKKINYGRSKRRLGKGV
jgi:hypothetical protein